MAPWMSSQKPDRRILHTPLRERRPKLSSVLAIIAAASIAWVPQGAIYPRGHGGYESWAGIELVKSPSMAFGIFARRPRFPAWRCIDCKHVEFSYEERVILR